MNATRTIDIALQTDLSEVAPTENFTALQQPAQTGTPSVRLQRGAFLIIALLLVSLAFAIRSSINEIEQEVNMIHANMTTPIFASPR